MDKSGPPWKVSVEQRVRLEGVGRKLTQSNLRKSCNGHQRCLNVCLLIRGDVDIKYWLLDQGGGVDTQVSPQTWNSAGHQLVRSDASSLGSSETHPYGILEGVQIPTVTRGQ